MNTPSTIRIGVTGGIATGKTTVTNYIAHTYGFPVLDADVYAKEAVAIGSPLLTKIQQQFGDSILLSTGELDRPQLGQIIFNDGAAKQWLESLIHPYVKQRFHQELQQRSDRCIILAIPLLFEARLENLVDQVWVVGCSEEHQLGRLMARNSLSKEAAISRIKAQMPLQQKILLADRVLDNDQSLTELYQQIDSLIAQI